MALTDFQRAICRLLADQRIASGESYVAGASALNELIGAPRLSRDIDLFHDTDEALEASWEADRRTLRQHGFEVRVVRQRRAFVEAEVSREDRTVLMEWARDSAYRFFPLLQHADFGLTLHPFDLATNKVLALIGRLEARDWIDVIHASERIQPLGYPVWAACGKDPGFSPPAILECGTAGALLGRRDPDPLLRGTAARSGRALTPVARGAHRRVRDRRHASSGEGRTVRSHPGRDAVPRRRGGAGPDARGGGILFHPGAVRAALPSVKSGD